MAVVDDLLRNAHEDTELLKKNDALGDNFSIARDVDFVIKTPDRGKAEIIRSFAEDNQYGVARVEEGEREFRVLVVINMPITQHVLCSVSALMVCIAALFGAEYDGWGCTIQRSM
jgi:Regulator of ribonuclease activity B